MVPQQMSGGRRPVHETTPWFQNQNCLGGKVTAVPFVPNHKVFGVQKDDMGSVFSSQALCSCSGNTLNGSQAQWKRLIWGSTVQITEVSDSFHWDSWRTSLTTENQTSWEWFQSRARDVNDSKNPKGSRWPEKWLNNAVFSHTLWFNISGCCTLAQSLELIYKRSGAENLTALSRTAWNVGTCLQDLDNWVRCSCSFHWRS